MNLERIPNKDKASKYDMFPIIKKLEATNTDILDVGNFKQLSQEVSSSLFHQAVSVIEKSFGQNYKEDLSDQDVRDFLSNGHLYLIINNQRDIIGIELLQLLDIEGVEIMYTGGAAIDPAYQGKNIHSDFRDYMIERNKPQYIAGRTQNPIVYKVYCKSPGTVYPDPKTSVPTHIQKLAMKISETLHMTNFNPTTLIQKEAYGGAVYGKDRYPVIDIDSDTSKMFSQLEIEKGDAFLILKSLEEN